MNKTSGHISDEFNCLLDFLSGYDNWQDEDKLFERVNGYLSKVWGASPLLVYSHTKRFDSRDKKIQGSLRSIWNREAAQKKYNQDNLEKLIFAIMQERIEREKKWEVLEIGETSFYVFYLGDDDYQSYLGVFKTEDSLNLKRELFSYLVNFVHNSFEQIQDWKRMKRANSLIHVDDVTGLYNQRKLIKDLENAIEKFETNNESFMVLFIDIDHFKYINDGYGHLVGTQVLSDLGRILKNVLRESDLLYRYGGDEFVVIIPDALIVDAKRIGERILTAVKSTPFEIEGNDTLRVSVSIGIASFPGDARNGHDVLAMADRMMYRAKESGRGKVCLAGDFYKKV